METNVSFRLKENMMKDLRDIERKMHIDRSEVVRRLLNEAIKEWKLNNALEDLSKHKISIGKAAENAEISLSEIIEKASDKGVNWMGYSDEDLERDLKYVK